MRIGASEVEVYSVSEEKSINFKVNYRSLEVKIGENTFKPESRGKCFNLKLSKEIMDFLRERENVIHLNLISQILNNWNYFEIWQDESKINVGRSPDVKQDEVIKTQHEDISIDEPLEDEISYYPIWRYEGNRNSSKSKHWIYFDILVYILSNIFVEFRKEFMSLLTIELQVAQVKGESLEEIKTSRELELEREITRLRGENNDLISKVDKLIEENKNTIAKLEEISRENRETHERLDITNASLNMVNTRIENLTNLVVEVRDQSIQNSQVIINQINEKYADVKIMTGSAKEVLFLIESREFSENLKIGTTI